MTGVLVALLAILWAIVLVPPLLRTRENTTLIGSVGTFHRGMKALGSNHSQPLTGGRYVLTPRTPLDAPDPKLVIYRRRRIFSGMTGGLVLTLLLGAIPMLRPLWWASLVLAIGVGGFAAFLISEKSRSIGRQRLSTPASPGRPPARRPEPAMPGVLHAFDDEVHVLTPSKPVFRVFDEDEDDDGLSEVGLGWARAGHL